jgi:predicted permease
MFGLLSGNGFSDAFTVVDSPADDQNMSGVLVGPNFFDVVGTRIVAGRGFERSDAESPVRVAVVNQTMAKRFFGAQPLGKRFTIPRPFPGESFEIVGVAIDSKYRDLRREAERTLPIVYLPSSQPPGASLALRIRDVQVEVRAASAAAALEPAIRRIVRELDPGVAVTAVRGMSDVIDRTIAQERMLARLATWLAMLALALGAIGIYGVRSYAVRRRTHEIGLRIALGATSSRVFGFIVGQGLAVAAIGIVIGLGAAAGLSRFVAGLLFGIEPLDTSTFIAVPAVFVFVSLIASYLPARRAARVDPATALRSE